MSLYSERFLGVTGTQDAEWWVPASKRAVIRCITAINIETTAGWVLVWAGGHYVYYASLAGSTSITPVDMRMVLYMGERLAVSASGTGVSLTISGYLFNDAAEARRAPTGPDATPQQQGPPLPLKPESGGALPR